MKRDNVFHIAKVAFALLLAAAPIVCSAQDIIVTTSSERIDGKVLEVSEKEIKYRAADNLDGPIFIIPTSKISSIVYSNGKAQSFSSAQSSTTEQITSSIKHSGLTLRRYGGRIVDSRSLYEPAHLDELLGPVAFAEYENCRSTYNTGAVLSWIGVGLAATSVIFLLDYAETGNDFTGDLAVPIAVLADVFIPIGLIISGVAKGKISRLAEHYNEENTRSLSMQMSLSPTLLTSADGHAAPGVGLSIRF